MRSILKWSQHFVVRGSRLRIHGVVICRTCCNHEHPDRPGRHVGNHGYRPWWIKVDDGEWANLDRAGSIGFFDALDIAVGLAANTAEVCQLLE